MRLLAPVSIYVALLMGLLTSMAAQAAPMFARQYGVSCMTCHAAFPRLNEYGEQFAANNFRMPNWKDTTLQTGDDQLALPSQIPIAVRVQAFTQARTAERIDDVVTGDSTQADGDFQAPYLIKLLSSAPLSDHITFYFYGIMAEKGGNGETIIEDAWFSHDDVFGTGTGMMLGQFQVSDLMFPRETRLTFQDYMAYRLAGITYERGVVFDHGFGGVDIALGLVNGNGIKENLTINSPGYQRPDHLFDNDNKKSVFMRVGTDIGPVSTGLFAYAGEQRNATGDAGMEQGDRYTNKRVTGLDLSGQVGGKTYWFAQVLMNQWDDFINQNTSYDWLAGFIGVDYVTGDRWTYSLLYNYAEADDFKNTDTIYEGIEMNSLSLNASYYFMRNLKGVIEVNYDLLDEVQQTGSFYTGHLSSEDYILFGFDAAF